MRYNPELLEVQFNNRARVPNHADVMAGWAKASALVTRGSTCELDIPYAEGSGQTLDVFPALGGGTSPAPVLVFIHGGYWRSLDKADFSFVAPAFNAAGAVVVVPNYGLCPAVGMEQICLQMAQAVLWVRQNAARWGGDPHRIALVGHSAGAHLVAMLLSCRWKELEPSAPSQVVTGALGISGLYDLEPLRHTPSLQKDLQLTATSVARMSPAFFPRPKGARLFTVAGLEESDEFLRQNRLIREVWGPTAVPVCETLPGLNHFNILNTLVDDGSRLHDLALRLLGLH